MSPGPRHTSVYTKWRFDPSSRLATIFCCCVSSEFSDYLVRCSPDCGRFWQTGLSASPTLGSYCWSSSYIYAGEFRRAPCWAPSYSCSIPLRFSALWLCMERSGGF